MIDLKKIQQILQMQSASGQKDLPKHIVINLFPVVSEEEKKKEDYKKYLLLVESIADLQADKNIPICTISLGQKKDILDETMLSVFCEKLLEKAVSKKMNVSILGRWYDLSGELVEALKKINNETKDFDSFFFNLCINYDGKQEIADACRVIIKKAVLGKADSDSVVPELIKENIYSSYFIPPDLIIESSGRLSGTFLWDSAGANIFFMQKDPLKMTREDIEKAISLHSKRD